MYYIYILESEKDNKHYIGFTSNLEERLAKHNKGYVQATKHRRPLKLIYYEQLEDRDDAYRREREIKAMKGGVQFKALIESSNGRRVAGCPALRDRTLRSGRKNRDSPPQGGVPASGKSLSGNHLGEILYTINIIPEAMIFYTNISTL